MKTNRLMLIGLLSSLALFSMGSSCGGDAEQANQTHAQQASDEPKKTPEEAPSVESNEEVKAQAQESGGTPKEEEPNEEMTEEALVVLPVAESVSVQAQGVPESMKCAVIANNVSLSAGAAVFPQIVFPAATDEENQLLPDEAKADVEVQEVVEGITAECCVMGPGQNLSNPYLTCYTNATMSYFQFSEEDQAGVTSFYSTNLSTETPPSFMPGSSFFFKGKKIGFGTENINLCTVLIEK